MESLDQLQGFFWIFIRIGIFLSFLPFFSARGIPAMWKVGLSFILAVVLIPVVPPPSSLPKTALEVILGVGSEILLGMVLALSVRVLLTSVQMAGQFLGFQMGFNMASTMDPVSGGQSIVVSQALNLVTVLLFFSINGHHMFIKALASSFHVVPPNAFYLNSSVVFAVLKISSEMFVIALKIAAPIMIALFLSNICLGIVARTVPQVNILMVGFPLNICLGLILFIIVLNNLGPFFEGLVRRMGEVMMGLLRIM
jgi:flagellar biosynthetic protein FliR